MGDKNFAERLGKLEILRHKNFFYFRKEDSLAMCKLDCILNPGIVQKKATKNFVSEALATTYLEKNRTSLVLLPQEKNKD